jgi:hypothetical protein
MTVDDRQVDAGRSPEVVGVEDHSATHTAGLQDDASELKPTALANAGTSIQSTQGGEV